MEAIKSLKSNIRFYILLLSFSFSIAFYLWIQQVIPAGPLQLIRLTQVYAFSAGMCLYFALLAGPFCYQIRWFPFRSQYIKARRAIGVSAFYFAALHAYLAFFKQLGGFSGLSYLNGNFLLAISLSFAALLILGTMAATSVDRIIDWMSFPRWKFLHRFVYLAGVFILIHALMLGTHFQDLSGVIPKISFILLAFLLYLEVRRIDAFIEKRFGFIQKFGIATILFSFVVACGVLYYIWPVPNGSGGFSLGIHAQHIQIAKEAQTANTPFKNVPNFPGLIGDRTKRFSVTFDHAENILPSKDTQLTFKIYDASSGNPVLLFNKPYEKTMHLIIVSSDLTYYEHIHPEQHGSEFIITTKFPKDGMYHLYTDFQPIGAIEQQFGFTVSVGKGELESLPKSINPDTNLTKSVDDYKITFSANSPLLASKLSVGEETVTFTIKDKEGKPITNLEPYLASFGHLVMINAQTFDYLHVHPTNIAAPKPEDRSGSNVSFLPLGLYGSIKPGIYKVFAQFKPDGKLILVDFTVNVE